MDAIQHKEATFPDERTFQAWEDMRIEVLHGLQEGANTDVPDSLVEDMGSLVVTLESWRTEAMHLKALPSNA